VAHVCETYTRGPKKSTTRASLELQIPQQTMWKILPECLKMFPYKLQLVPSLSMSNNDRIICHPFCMDVQQQSEDDTSFIWLIVSDE
jgi:hypothetical protein